ncbi:MAG: hypothetical protein HY22_04460 [[Candidatus Thermochlorobacteriaceae] bacterium GBChlB]|nr:MAG: hypothetical protein HY22_04460 [[Candidatus Thermochlorobacteriaceae] bacterium GBChlB]
MKMNMIEKYLPDLPDYIKGNVPKSVAVEIEKLIATNAKFRAEYDAMRSVMQRIEMASEVMQSEMEQGVPPFYFANFADKVEQRIAAAQRTPMERVFAGLRRLLEPKGRFQLAGICAAALIVAMLFNGVLRLDFHIASGDIAALKRAYPEAQDEKNPTLATRVATVQFAAGFMPEVSLSSLNDEEEIAVLNKLKEELPTADDGDFNILSDDDVKSLLPTL